MARAALVALVIIFGTTASATHYSQSDSSDSDSSSNGVVCSPPNRPDYGGYSSENDFYGLRRGVRFFCNDGYQLVGSSWTACVYSYRARAAVWYHPTPTCKKVPEVIECPRLSDPRNGDVNLPRDRVPGSKATYSCDRGFNLFGGDAVRKCGSDGRWSGDAPTCESIRIECPRLSDPRNGDVNLPRDRVPGSKATYSCDRGFNLFGGDAVRKCGSDGRWSGDAPTCERIECPPLSDPRNGDVNLPRDRVPGSKATYSCDRGFSLFGGDAVRKCGSDGRWSGDEPTCEKIDCGSLDDPAFGEVSLSGTVFGSMARYSCQVGYFLDGQSTRTCEDTGWSGQAPICRIVDCGDLPDPQSGRVEHPETTFGSKARYSCDRGFDLVGDAVRKCQANRQWSGEAPICEKIDCGSLDDPAFGEVSLSGTIFGSTARYSCQVGYFLDGQSTRTCGDNGWSGQAPICRIVDCGDLDDPDFGRVFHPRTTFGSTATYRCQEGYVLKGSQTRVCQSNGEWSNEAPICKLVIIDCGGLDAPSFGKVVLSGTTAGSTASYSCFQGYVLLGNTRRICQSTGRWSGRDPVCKLIDCGLIDPPDNGWVHIPCTRIGCVALFGCRSGFTKVGDKARTCTYYGTWSGNTPTCERDYDYAKTL